jgi:hypothetical protein
VNRKARAAVPGLRQETQFTCCATSIAACLQAHGKDQTEADVNKILGASPMSGASWEAILATLQYFGLRGNLVVPATVTMLKEWTDKGIPVIIAWNPEGRPWSHASVVADVTDGPDGRYVHVMDSNIPNPDKTFRILHEDEFCAKWGEKVSDSLIVRRPACAVEREVTVEGRQVRASWNPFKREKPNPILELSLDFKDKVRRQSSWFTLDPSEKSGDKMKALELFRDISDALESGNVSFAASALKKIPRAYSAEVPHKAWKLLGVKHPFGDKPAVTDNTYLHDTFGQVRLSSIQRVLARKAGIENGKLDDKTIRLANAAMSRKGLDGNGRFLKATGALSLALETLDDFGIELGEVVSSHMFSPESNTLNIDLAFTNPADSFSPVSITNSMLHLSYTRLDNDRFEVLAYLT